MVFRDEGSFVYCSHSQHQQGVGSCQQIWGTLFSHSEASRHCRAWSSLLEYGVLDGAHNFDLCVEE